jgi:hypothetical protein
VRAYSSTTNCSADQLISRSAGHDTNVTQFYTFGAFSKCTLTNGNLGGLEIANRVFLRRPSDIIDAYRDKLEGSDKMAAIPSSIHLKGLGSRAMNDLTAKAKRLGMTPDRYVKQLVEDDLALDRNAKTTSLSGLMGPGLPIDEAELDKLVDAARTRHHRRSATKYEKP